MSDIGTSAETFESILEEILEGCKKNDRNKFGSKIKEKNKELLDRLKLKEEKEEGAFNDDDYIYTFDRDKDIKELLDNNKREIMHTLIDLFNNGCFKDYKKKSINFLKFALKI